VKKNILSILAIILVSLSSASAKINLNQLNKQFIRIKCGKKYLCLSKMAPLAPFFEVELSNNKPGTVFKVKKRGKNTIELKVASSPRTLLTSCTKGLIIPGPTRATGEEIKTGKTIKKNQVIATYKSQSNKKEYSWKLIGKSLKSCILKNLAGVQFCQKEVSIEVAQPISLGVINEIVNKTITLGLQGVLLSSGRFERIAKESQKPHKKFILKKQKPKRKLFKKKKSPKKDPFIALTNERGSVFRVQPGKRKLYPVKLEKGWHGYRKVKFQDPFKRETGAFGTEVAFSGKKIDDYGLWRLFSFKKDDLSKVMFINKKTNSALTIGYKYLLIKNHVMYEKKNDGTDVLFSINVVK
jgi:hypothetical protein